MIETLITISEGNDGCLLRIATKKSETASKHEVQMHETMIALLKDMDQRLVSERGGKTSSVFYD